MILTLNLEPEIKARAESRYSSATIDRRLTALAALDSTPERDADGVYTGALAGPFCYGEGKAQVLSQVAAQRGYDLSRSYAYSDSVSDLPMLAAVGFPVVVNPEAELRQVADEQGWPVLDTGLPRLSLGSPRDLLRLGGRALRGAARIPRLVA